MRLRQGRSLFLCLFERIRREENAELLALRTNDPDFAHPDFTVHS